MTGGPGGVYVAVRAGDSVVVALVELDGDVAPGWPIELPTRYCTALRTADDGSLRAACDRWFEGSEGDGGGLQAPVLRIFGLDGRGRSLPGWPVDIEGGSIIEMLGEEVQVVIRPYLGDSIELGDVEPAVYALIGPTGDVRLATDEIDVACCQSTLAIGAGQAYAVNRFYDYAQDDLGTSELLAFGLDGLSWKAEIDGIASDPGFDFQGNAYVSVWSGEPDHSRLLKYDDAGRLVANSDVPIAASNGWSGAGYEYAAAPIVAGDGSLVLIDDLENQGTKIVAIDKDGSVRDGWPFYSEVDTEDQGECGPEDTGCGVHRVTPQFSDDGLFVALRPSARDIGGSLVALDGTGSIRPGWPVGLVRRGGQFWQLLHRPDGGLWAAAAEPAGETHDVTLLSIASDSSVVGKITIVEGATIGP